MQKIDLDEPLFHMVSGTGEIPITVRMSCNGFMVLGGIGSGKTTSSGALLAIKMLAKGWGGLVLTVKNSERDSWVSYAKRTGRSNDLKIIEPGGHHRFNWLSYLSSRSNGSELTDNIVDVMKTVIKAGEEKNAGSGSDGSFWDGALDQVLSFSVELLKRAYGDGGVTIERLYELMQSLPKPGVSVKPQDGKEPSAFWIAYSTVKDNLKKAIHDWEVKLGVGNIASLKERGIYLQALNDACPDYRPVKHLDDFFLDTYRNLTSKTRSVVDFMVSGFLFRMLKEPVFSLFNGPSTVIPELIEKGKIILVNLPTKEFSKVGRDAQLLVKFIVQKSLEARKMHENTVPAFIFIDEAHEVLHPYDVDFQAVSRENRIISVFISQNLNNYISIMGGNRPENKVMALAGVFGNKIFHANADQHTNEYSSNLCGEGWYPEFNEGTSMQDKFSFSNGKSYKLQKHLLPQDFQKLKTGGPINNFIVDAIIHCQGTPLFDGENFMKVSFRQQLQSI